MSMTLGDYIDLITSQHRHRPKFSGVVASAVAPLAATIGMVDTSALQAWDIDVAVGTQLDQVGEWIGANRYIEQPLVGIYFSWDDVVATGWQHGYWQGKYDPNTGVIALADDVYRLVLYAKIASNNWNGTRETIEAIWDESFGDQSTLALIDHQDMSITIALQGIAVNDVLVYILTSGRIPLKPEGVRLREYIVSDNRIFGFDADSPTIGGWDEADWGSEIIPA